MINEDITKFKMEAWKNPSTAGRYEYQVNNTNTFQFFLAQLFLSDIFEKYPDCPNTRVLDLGCGTGILFNLLANRGYVVDGIDISEEMLKKIDLTRFKEKSCRLILGDIFDLSFVENFYDVIVSRWVLPHFPNWQMALSGIFSSLRRGGTFHFDITSRENYSKALSDFGFEYENFFYDDRVNAPNGGKFYASIGFSELRGLVEEKGFILVDVRPYSFFYANPILCGGKGPRASAGEFQDKLNSLYASDTGRKFLQYFETFVTPRISLSECNAWRVTIQKPE